MRIFLLFLAMLFVGGLGAQQQLENGNFEVWQNVGAATEEPENWSSLKTADALAGTAPQVLSQDAGRNGGFAARLEVKSVFGIAANGLMTNGRVHADFNPENGYVFTDANDPQWHTTFTDRPDSIVGWYKYAPQNSDKGKVEIILHTGQARLPFDGFQANIVGRAKAEFAQAQVDWLRFSAPFVYWTAGTPAYILTTVAAGDSTISKNGTVLWVDDFELVYNETTTGIAEFVTNPIAINASNGYLLFDSGVIAPYNVYASTGALVQSGTTSQKVPFAHQSGVYFIEVRIKDDVIRRKLYIH